MPSRTCSIKHFGSHKCVAHVIAIPTNGCLRDYQALLGSCADLIDTLRSRQAMPPSVTLTVDSLFSNLQMPLDMLARNIYVCVATKLAPLSTLAYSLQHDKHRIFVERDLMMLVYHDRSRLSASQLLSIEHCGVHNVTSSSLQKRR